MARAVEGGGKVKGENNLKNLYRELLGRDIQKGRKGHCSFEDAFAAQEVANFFVLRSKGVGEGAEVEEGRRVYFGASLRACSKFALQ